MLFRNLQHQSSFLGKAATTQVAQSSQTPLEEFQSEFKRLTSFNSFAPIKFKGRIFESDKILRASTTSKPLATITGKNLFGNESTFPQDLTGKVKFLSLSFQQYGYNLTKSFADPFYTNFESILNEPNSPLSMADVTFADYKFLTLFHKSFSSGMKKGLIEARQNASMIVYGGCEDYAFAQFLPSKFTGYIFLLDSQNRVRWQACGSAQPQDLEILYGCTKDLLGQEARLTVPPPSNHNNTNSQHGKMKPSKV